MKWSSSSSSGEMSLLDNWSSTKDSSDAGRDARMGSIVSLLGSSRHRLSRQGRCATTSVVGTHAFTPLARLLGGHCHIAERARDRKRAVSGKSVAVRVELG